MRFIQLAMVFSVAISITSSCGKKQESTFPKEESITNAVYASGVIKSRNQYEAYSKVNGVIESILVKEGDVVKKGQSIIRLSNTAQTLNYENAKANATFNSMQTNKEKIQQATTELELAKAKLDNDASLFERQKKLWAQEIGTKNDLDQRELNFKNAQTLFNASKLKLDDLKKQLEFQNTTSSKNLSISASTLSDFEVKSQVDGKVYNINKKVGEMASTQTPIATIGASNDFYIEMHVDEFDITKIKLGQKVLLSLDSYKGKSFEAEITKVFPIMDEKTKTFKVEASFKVLPENLFPNLSAEANIVIETKNKALTIPSSYITENTFVLLKNKEKRKIEIGLKDYEKTEVLSGLSIKDEIVKPQ